jgi:integral membrane protein
MRGPMASLHTPLGRLRVIGFWEGVSFLVLLGIAMPLKYLAGWPDAVRVVGLVHGILFILYVGATFQAAIEYSWPFRRTLLILAASILPAGPFVVDARVLRHEREPS